MKVTSLALLFAGVSAVCGVAMLGFRIKDEFHAFHNCNTTQIIHLPEKSPLDSYPTKTQLK